jgi:ADP-ribose pyrophosphatase YjhB (NUDIX family)
MTEGKAAGSTNFIEQVPDGDERTRLVCVSCGFIRYDNPKIVVGSVVSFEDRILLCRRRIDPRAGFWTLPAGYMELNESPLDGARREAWEEARARIAIDALLAVYSIPRLSQVQLIYRARLGECAIAPGPESLEVGLFSWEAIPWDDLAFPSVHWALGHFREIGGAEIFAPRTNPPGETGSAGL